MVVKIYTTSACQYCNMAKGFFKKNDIDYEEISIEEDEKAVNEMIEKSGQLGVPVIDIDGEVIVGFDRSAIENAIRLKA